MTIEEASKRLFRTVIDRVWHRGELEYISHAFDPSFVAVVPRQPFQRLDAYRRYILEVRTAFPDICFRIEDQVAEGEMLVTRYTIGGTHTGVFMGIRPTGRRISVTGMTMHRVHDGKFAESWTQWDVAGLLHQLGVLPEELPALSRR
jgi:steroid delta-isomerase-like uncharacterized protein